MQNVGQVPIADGTRVRVELRAEGFDVYVNDVLARHVDSTELERQAALGPRARRRRRRDARATPRSGRCSTTSSGPGAPVHDDFERRRDRIARLHADRSALADARAAAGRSSGGEAVLESQPSLKPSIATVDVGRSDGWVQVTASSMPTGTGLVFRYRDPQNYFRITAVPQYGTLNVIKVVDGRETRVGSTGLTNFGNGSTIGVRLRGDAGDGVRRRLPRPSRTASPSCAPRTAPGS